MAIVRRNGPLPDNHPFKNGAIILGPKRPKQSGQASSDTKAEPTLSQAVEQDLRHQLSTTEPQPTDQSPLPESTTQKNNEQS